MTTLLSEIKASTTNEYNRAAAKFGDRHNGDHESYAVILEEYEEAMDEATVFKLTLHNFWNNVKLDVKNIGILGEMQKTAENAAAEWVQVAAMCHKARVTATQTSKGA